ncbi:MAG: DUF917 domain-containing protein, partial [Treponema sp.]|nr:DUF917 domain-containing protein [Treponema sp.]
MTLNEQDILRVIKGAALLASGGGGSVTDGLDLLANYKKRYPGKRIQVELIDTSDMADAACAVVIAGMGAPTKGAHKDFTLCAGASYDEIGRIAVREGKRIGYTMPIEMGGFNTIAPMLVSLARNYPVIDADGAGRAVPGLDTVLVHVNGYETSPLALADEHNNRVEIIMADPRDAAGAQKIAAPIANGYFDGNAGIAGWMLNRSQIEDALPLGTITLAGKIGLLIEKAKTGGAGLEDIFGMINGLDGIEACALTTATKIIGYTPNVNPDFDNGYYYIGSSPAAPQFKIAY